MVFLRLRVPLQLISSAVCAGLDNHAPTNDLSMPVYHVGSRYLLPILSVLHGNACEIVGVGIKYVLFVATINIIDILRNYILTREVSSFALL